MGCIAKDPSMTYQGYTIPPPHPPLAFSLTPHSVRGDGGGSSDLVESFYRQITALSGDQAPIFMVSAGGGGECVGSRAWYLLGEWCRIWLIGSGAIPAQWLLCEALDPHPKHVG